ncbi:hypothetical protein G6553_15295, partial [Nocardioides sp. IC4_145]|nr:hypothetical protein [Nocardioides sp. IC4_145]
MKGPQQLRLEATLDASAPEDVETRKNSWRLAAITLDQVATRLEANAAPRAREAMEGRTGPEVADAFTVSAQALRRKQQELKDAEDALTAASEAIREGEKARTQLRDLVMPTAPSRSPGSTTEQDVQAQKDHDTAVANFWADYEHNERVARDANTHMETTFTGSTGVMKKIHGIPDPVEPPIEHQPGGGGGGTPPSSGRRPTPLPQLHPGDTPTGTPTPTPTPT